MALRRCAGVDDPLWLDGALLNSSVLCHTSLPGQGVKQSLSATAVRIALTHERVLAARGHDRSAGVTWL